MATNEPTLLSMLLRPQGAVQSSQSRADASRDAQLFSESLDTAYRDQRTSRSDVSERSSNRSAAQSDSQLRNDQRSQRLAGNNDRRTAHLDERAQARERAADLAQSRSSSAESQDRLSARQREALDRLEPEQREAIEALPPAKQAQVLDELADSAENGLSDDSLSAILDGLDPQLREQLLALMQSLTDQATAGAQTETLLTQVEQASEAGQIPPELAAWLSDQLKAGAKTAGQGVESVSARLEAMQTSLKQALASVSTAPAAPGASIAKEGSAALGGLMEQSTTQQAANGQPVFAKEMLTSLDGQREQGALLETAKLHNLLAGRGESVDRPTAGSITTLTESLGLANRTVATPAAPKMAAQVLPGFNQSGWGDAVGQKVLWMAKQNITSADMRLDPPDLGTIHVRVSIQNDQAHVSFTSAQPVVREALDQHSARLREMLTEQGMTSVDVDVSDQRSFAESDPRAGGDEGARHSSGWSAGGSDGDAEDELGAAANLTQLGTVSLIDHYA
ncbi:flagellar hook-length control protein FliK [Gilvimarinus japonicus]|uniref:Flagellar hook-length control protein FliK n=1 Tax=Gilvimarinus japonicus TaxID=1796469 RepID=A0ABV7HMM9_9GAMM